MADEETGRDCAAQGVSGLEIDGDNIEALLKGISTLTQVTGGCVDPKESQATLDADAEVAKFHD